VMELPPRRLPVVPIAVIIVEPETALGGGPGG
jgi:hypothetical protein